MANATVFNVGGVDYKVKDTQFLILDNTLPFGCLELNKAVTYYKSYSYVTHTLGGKYNINFMDLDIGSAGSVDNIIGMILECNQAIYTMPGTGVEGSYYSVPAGLAIWSNRSTTVSIGVLPKNSTSWGAVNVSAVMSKNVTLQAGLNFVQLTNLKALKEIPNATEFWSVFINGAGLDNFGMAVMSNENMAGVLEDNLFNNFIPFNYSLTYNNSYSYASKITSGLKAMIFSNLEKTAEGEVNAKGIIGGVNLNTTYLYKATADLYTGDKVDTDLCMILYTDTKTGASIGIAIPDATSWNSTQFKTLSKTVTLSPGYTVVRLDDLLAQTNIPSGTVYGSVFMTVAKNVTDFGFYLLPTNLLVGIILDQANQIQDIRNIINAGTTDIVFWGDSLTQGAGGNGTTYCQVCAELLGKAYRNMGIGGETEQTIAARQGGNNLLIPAGSVNGTYTPAQMLDAHGKQILPLKQGSSGVNPVIVNGQSCTLEYSENDNEYTLSGYTGTLLFKANALFSGYSVLGDITVIFVGTNGLSANTVSERIEYINSMLSRVGNKYVVMGISVGTEADMASDDAAMLSAFGNHFFPTRKMLVNYGLAVQSITPTSQDETDIAAGTVPTSLRSDSVHLNADGYTALGKMLASFMVGLGYGEYAE